MGYALGWVWGWAVLHPLAMVTGALCELSDGFTRAVADVEIEVCDDDE